mmetsp:Transcript_7443/g.30794  ORF Transcript_7443/g.30794 Transcript_7443/m.30794 type:complete len:273 (-) Transcript_7443:270-1088(-)
MHDVDDDAVGPGMVVGGTPRRAPAQLLARRRDARAERVGYGDAEDAVDARLHDAPRGVVVRPREARPGRGLVATLGEREVEGVSRVGAPEHRGLRSAGEDLGAPGRRDGVVENFASPLGFFANRPDQRRECVFERRARLELAALAAVSRRRDEERQFGDVSRRRRRVLHVHRQRRREAVLGRHRRECLRPQRDVARVGQRAAHVPAVRRDLRRHPWRRRRRLVREKGLARERAESRLELPPRFRLTVHGAARPERRALARAPHGVRDDVLGR